MTAGTPSPLQPQEPRAPSQLPRGPRRGSWSWCVHWDHGTGQHPGATARLQGHGECLGATQRGASSPSGRWGVPQGHGEGLGTALRAMGSTARPWRASLAARQVPPGCGLGKHPGAVAGATATTSAPQQLLLGHGEDLGHGQHLRSTTGTVVMASTSALWQGGFGQSTRDTGQGFGVAVKTLAKKQVLGPWRRLWPW